jgi:superfamily II DNA/RNA helicase
MTNGNHKLGTKDNFERRFMDESGQKLRNTTIMRILLNPYIHHVEPTPALAAPKKVTEVVKIDMSPEQQELYQFVMDKMDPVTAVKFRFGSSKLKTNEVQNIFNKMTQARQVANAIHTINQSVSLSDSAVRSPKIKHALDDVQEHLKETPDGQAIMYSNMIHGGVDVTSQGLKDRGIPFGVFIGKGQPGSTEKSRQQAVLDYKSGKTKVLLISSAGGEGLDLGNTTFVATLDGHFNPEKTLQAEARGIRSGGQAARAPEKRQVIVRRYVTSIPRSYSQTGMNILGLTSPFAALERMQKGAPVLYNPFKKERSPDEWAYEVAENKAKRNTQLKSFLDKHGSAEPECLEDVLDELEKLLEAQSEPGSLPAVKIAAMSEREKTKEHRLAAQRIPFQPNKLVKSDVHIMDSYLKKFGPELETALDIEVPLKKEEDRIEEQKHINALRKYYVEAAKGMGIKPGASDKDVYKDVALIAALSGPVVGVSAAVGPIMFSKTPAERALKTLAAAAGGAALIGGFSIPLLWTPRFTTPKTKAKRMSRLSDNELRQVLRGLQVEQKEEKVSKYYIGGKKG